MSKSYYQLAQENIEKSNKSIKLYDILKDKVKFKEKYCDDLNCLFCNGEFNFCELFRENIILEYPTRKSLQKEFFRLDKCINIFGE